MNFGLKEQDVEYIVAAIDSFSEINKAVIFGSRAKGSFKAGSDIDIAIFGENVTFQVVAKLHSILEDDSPMPYLFDVVDYTHLEHDELRQHIDRIGEVVFERNAGSKAAG